MLSSLKTYSFPKQRSCTKRAKTCFNAVKAAKLNRIGVKKVASPRSLLRRALPSFYRYAIKGLITAKQPSLPLPFFTPTLFSFAALTALKQILARFVQLRSFGKLLVFKEPKLRLKRSVVFFLE